ncbi:MAG: DNA primase [Anaerolineales bacterium]
MSVVDEIKGRLDIVDIVSGYTQIKKSGHSYKGLCPFHSERTPSFVVFPGTQTWRCFGQCGVGGDVFGFYMRAEGLEFKEALRDLAQRAGVELKSQNQQASEDTQIRERLYHILELMQNAYFKTLPGSPAEAYARQRGLNNETIEAFKLGYAPPEWSRALDYLRKHGFSMDEIRASGMLSESSKTGKIYDRFRNRFMIPIRDGRGRPIAFGARLLEDDPNAPKYLNSPQTELFDKSQTLFGYDLARRAIRETETAIFVEGYLDVMQAHQAGYQNVIAPMGTSLTAAQLETVARYARRIILALDADTAGLKATQRGLEVAREALGDSDTYVMDARGYFQQAGHLKIDIRVLHLPEGKDPDDFIRARPDEWPAQVEAARPLSEFLIENAVADLPDHPSVAERQHIAQKLLPLLSATEDSLLRHDNIQMLSAKLRLDPREVITWAESLTRREGYAAQPQKRRPSKARAQAPKPAPPPADVPLVSRARILERYCLSVMIQRPERFFEANRLLREVLNDTKPPFAEGLSSEDFSYTDFQRVFELLQVARAQFEMEPIDYLREYIEPDLQDTLHEILIEPLDAYTQRAGRLPATELESFLRERDQQGYTRTIDEFPIRLLMLRHERLGKQAAEITFIIGEAQEEQQPEQEEAWRLAFSEINRKMNTLKRAIHNLQNLSAAR